MRTIVYLNNMGTPCFNFGPLQVERLKRAMPELDITICRDEADLLHFLPEARIVIVWRFEQAWFDLAPRLRWLITPAAGRDYFAVSPPPHVRQFYGSFHGKLMGETAVGMLLGASRGIILAMQAKGCDPWPSALLSSSMRLLRDSHVVILGFGNIGRWIGRLAKPFGPRLTGINRHGGERPDYFNSQDRLATMAELDAILPDTDHLVVCLPSGSATDLLLDRRRFSLLPSYAWVHNLGRGNCIDEAALVDALRQGTLGGACLDVFQKEPLPMDSPLRQAPNLLIMPHASAYGPEYMDTFVDEIVARLQDA